MADPTRDHRNSVEDGFNKVAEGMVSYRVKMGLKGVVPLAGHSPGRSVADIARSSVRYP